MMQQVSTFFLHFWKKSATIGLDYWTRLLDPIIGPDYCTGQLDLTIRPDYWTRLLDSAIGPDYWTRLLYMTIGPDYWSGLYQFKNSLIYCSCKVYQRYCFPLHPLSRL